MEPHSIDVTFTGHYYTAGDLDKASSLWFVLHGYGQLASYFLKSFHVLLDHRIAVIAPEALSRFYLEDTVSRLKSGNDRVGASWMTKEKRSTDIVNYLNFLNQVYEEVISQRKNIPITILGFSQGAATASRWVLDGKINFQRLILWAGIFPPDLDLPKGKSVLHDKEVYLVHGDKDPFLSDSRFTEMSTISESMNIRPVTKTFHGGHEINATTLKDLV